jgi:hypothetical protein
MSEPIRIFVGCAANNEDCESQAVLEYTLRKHHSSQHNLEPIQIEWMMQSRDPTSFWHGWNTATWATPFSGFRWGVPARCNFEGKAIYLDSDMIVMDDIAKLWYTPITARHALISKGANKRFCTTLFDCAKIKPYMYPIEYLRSAHGAHRAQRERLTQSPLVQPLPPGENWNCVDGEAYVDIHDPTIKIHHYSAIDSQPQLKYALPRLAEKGQAHWFKGNVQLHWRQDLVTLFDRTLQEAIAAGYEPSSYEHEPFGDYAKGGSEGGVFVKGGPAVRGV